MLPTELRFTVVLGFLLLASPLSAQVVRGSLVEEGTGTPVDGALVVLLDRHGGQRGAALTDPRGRFRIVAPGPGAYRLRAERIGYANSTSGVLRLVAGETLHYRMETPAEAVELAGITASAARRCVLRPEQGRATQRLWEEARKALNSAAWTHEQGRFRFTALEYERELALGSLQVEQEQQRVRSYFGGTPYLTRSAAELDELGYIEAAADTMVYYAPDADVLLSDVFLDTHCFRVVPGGAEEGLAGLAFEPQEGRTRPDISGVLWLDERTAELRFLEYAYTRLPLPGPAEPFGGRIEFERLPMGAWIIPRWRIRMPIAGVQVNWSRQGEEREVIAAIKETGGEVRRTTSLDGAVVSEAARAVLEGVVFDSTRGGPLADATVSLSGTEHTAATDEDGRFRMEDLSSGEYALRFHHPRIDSLGLILPPKRVSLERGRTAAVELAIPGLTRILAAACPEAEREPGTGVLVGVVRDSLTGEPLAGTEVTLSWGVADPVDAPSRLQAHTDGEGVFRFCAAPTGRSVTVRAQSLGRSSPPTRVEVAGEAPGRRDLAIHLTQAVRVVGRLVNQETDEPIPAAHVELPDLDRRATTDERGRFVFSDVPPGSHTLAIEHLAYGSHSEMLSVTGAATFDIEVRLANQAIALEPITVAVRARSASPRLAGFHERRERGLRGHFVTRDDLERSTATKLTDVLRTVPGVRVVLGTGPNRYAVRMVRQPARLGTGRLSAAAADDSGPMDCPPQVYIDGIPWGGPIDEITLRDIEGIEVYRGASEVPGEFGGSNASCGVIALWSRRGG